MIHISVNRKEDYAGKVWGHGCTFRFSLISGLWSHKKTMLTKSPQPQDSLCQTSEAPPHWSPGSFFLSTSRYIALVERGPVDRYWSWKGTTWTGKSFLLPPLTPAAQPSSATSQAPKSNPDENDSEKIYLKVLMIMNIFSFIQKYIDFQCIHCKHLAVFTVLPRSRARV